MINIIAAISNNRVIGNKGKLPWHLPEDLKHFKEKTLNSTIVMGRKTFESLPHLLPGRTHIVLTRSAGNIRHPFVQMAKSIEEVLELKEDIFIIGGAEIYEQFLPYADKIYLTIIDENFEGDTFFPQIDGTKWMMNPNVKVGEKNSKNPYNYYFVEYRQLRRKGRYE